MQSQDGFFLQFIKLAGPFWRSQNKLKIRLDTALFVALTLAQIMLAVVITQWNADLFDAIEQHSMAGIITQVFVLIVIFIGSVSITTLHLIVKRRLLIGWRLWLTEQVIAKWMHKGRHYQITLMGKSNYDNPDGRIAEDIRIATEEAFAMGHSMFYSVMLLFSFANILWQLSGKIELDLWLVKFPIAGYLVWISVVYSIGASVLGWWMGKPLIKATDARQTEEADFRYCLIKAQENSQDIALINGEDYERQRFLNSFQAIVQTYAQQTAAWTQIQIFTSGYSVATMALPILVAAPRYIVGAISLGNLMQSVQAFQHMVNALSWPANNMAQIAKWRTSVERVLGLVKALDDLDHDISCLNSHQICVSTGNDSVLKFNNVNIADLEGNTISTTINTEIKAGEHILVSGHSSTAAKLFQAIAGLWPWGKGHIQVPQGERLFFMSPRPYLPTDTLLTAICYPTETTAFNRVDLEKLLKKAGLKDLIKQLDDMQAWEKLLSREQRQRLGAVRALVYRPKWLFVQEALDSLPPEGETEILSMLANELPGTTILRISNQPGETTFHHRILKI